MNPLLPILGVGALFLLSRKGGGAQSMNAMATEKFGRLYQLTGSDQWDLSKTPMTDVVRDFQLTMGVTRTDGVYDAETNSVLDDAIAGFA